MTYSGLLGSMGPRAICGLLHLEIQVLLTWTEGPTKWVITTSMKPFMSKWTSEYHYVDRQELIQGHDGSSNGPLELCKMFTLKNG